MRGGLGGSIGANAGQVAAGLALILAGVSAVVWRFHRTRRQGGRRH
ncbi:hypothetical protein [Streptomyces sp. NPDC090021]